MSAKRLATFILAMLTAVAAPAATGAQSIDQAKLNTAVDRGVEYLLSRIQPEGPVTEDMTHPESLHYGGKTALVAYALLASGVDPSNERLARAIKWLSKAKLNSTYAIALRACMYSMLTDPQTLGPLKADVDWLMKASGGDAAYTYISQDSNKSDPEYDNSNSQMAVLGVWMASQRGIEVPASYWKSVEQHWLNQQQPDGGFGYTALALPARTKTYGSMTAAGLASLYICFDELRRNDYARCTGNTEYRPITDAMEWMSRNFSLNNPSSNGWNHYWMFCVERVGLAGGHKFIGKHDWFTDCVKELLETQLPDGNWGYENAYPETAFSLMFLAKGRNPILFNKLQYEGRWNSRPRDIANLTRWLGHTFERTLNWQIVEIDRPMRQWQDAPILYISGSSAAKFTDEQVQSLRDFVLQGGTILSEAACNNAEFSRSMRQLYKRMFPPVPAAGPGQEAPALHHALRRQRPGQPPGHQQRPATAGHTL